MRIIIYGINYSPELIGIGKYTGEMGGWLADKGYDVRVITAPAYYPNWRTSPQSLSWKYSKKIEDKVKVFRCPLFVPENPSAFSRLLHLLSFGMSSLPILFSQYWWRPNIVMLIVPTLFCAPQALFFAKISGAKSVLHIQDFEVDAMFSSGISDSKKLHFIAAFFEKWILISFDFVSSISKGMMERAKCKGVSMDRLRFLPNWSNSFESINIKRSSELLQKLGIDAEKKVILYSGNLGEKQGLELIIQAASQMQQNTQIVFLIVGTGPSKKRLVQMVEDIRLKNVLFSNLLNEDEFPNLLASVDVHLVIQKKGVADAVLPSKLTNILTIGGNAVITTEPDTTLGSLCKSFPGIALAVKPESVTDLINGINYALTMLRPNMIAREYANENLNKEVILTKFFEDLKNELT